MREGRGWARAAAQVASVVLAGVTFTLGPGCHFDRGELYEPRGGGAGSGDTAAVVEIPLLPAQPDIEVRPACEACAAEKCSEARDNCLEDDACTALLTCRGDCDDPACLQDCQAEHGFSPWYEDLWACVLNDSCANQCRSSQNWGCLGEYDWTPADPPRFPVTIRFENPRTTAWLGGDSRTELEIVGAEARTCASLWGDCTLGDLIDSDRVDVMNTVELNVEVSGFQRVFAGRIEVEDDSAGPFGLYERFLGRPFTRETTTTDFFAPRDFVKWNSGGAVDLENGAPIYVVVLDCLAMPARGVRVELPDLPGADLLHWNELGFEGGGGPTDRGVALVTDVSEPERGDLIAVRAVRADNGETVAEGDAFVRAGWTTHLLLWPRVR